MKPSRIFLLFALPLSVVACAKEVEFRGGSGGSGGDSGSSSSSASSSSSSSSSGAPGPCVSQADCVAFNDACNVGNCINGACAKTPANDGALCDDGFYCTEGDKCISGVCSGTSQKFCPSPDACHVGQCDEATKSCGSAPGNDGAACIDNDPCSATSSCSGGTCVGKTPVDCSFLNGACSVGVCDPQLGCITQPVPDGKACDDQFYCTVNDACKGGVCAGVPNTCAAPNDVCKIGVCNEAQKSCVAMPGNDGAACDDNNLCTSGETCSAGSCIGGQPANDGMACQDADGCTLGTTCSAGACVNPTSTVMQCMNGDQCCPAGCQMSDSDCSLTKWSEGSQNWPDEACNPTFSFGGCNTNAQDHADAWATAVCMLNGYSMGVWTGNKEGGCNGDTSMWCGGVIPCMPIWENQCAVGDQTKVEITCFP